MIIGAVEWPRPSRTTGKSGKGKPAAAKRRPSRRKPQGQAPDAKPARGKAQRRPASQGARRRPGEKQGLGKFLRDVRIEMAQGHLADAQGPHPVHARRPRRCRHRGRLHRRPRRVFSQPRRRGPHRSSREPGASACSTGTSSTRTRAMRTRSGPTSSIAVSRCSQEERIDQIVVPTEQVVETKDGEKVTDREAASSPATCWCRWSSPTTPGRWSRTLPGVTGFVGAQNKPVALSRAEVDRILHTASVERPKEKAEFAVGEHRARHVRAAHRLLRRGRRGQHRPEQAQGHGVHLRARDAGRAGFDQVKKTSLTQAAKRGKQWPRRS